MSSLNETDKRCLESVLGMDSGYVLDYTDATFGEFFQTYGVDIHHVKYQTYGTSKAKKLRAFWTQEPDDLVGNVLSELLDVYEDLCERHNDKIDQDGLVRARNIVRRLSGQPREGTATTAEDDFLRKNVALPVVRKLPIESAVVPIVEQRLDEIGRTLDAGAHLSTVVLCGSVLEAVLLGSAKREPELFNRSGSSPRERNGAVKEFRRWTLADLIDVASDLGVLKPDVKKFSHGLREFRNYIHPNRQLESGFTPDAHTAKVCFQVLKAALASVAGERRCGVTTLSRTVECWG